MATSLTFPVPVNLLSRRHRVTSDATKAARDDARRRHPSAMRPELRADVVISCAECSLQNSSACSDCVVTFVCGTSVAFGAAEADALAMFQEAGLLPGSQHHGLRTPAAG